MALRLPGRWAVAGASMLALLIGLAFVFVRAPHPWGWEGIDQYRELAWSIARGEPYPSLERSWGYPLFLSFFYATFGDRQWIPLVVQVACNAALPYLTYILARRHLDARIAAVAAVLVGVLSFNTIYASTQAADALCTVAFVASIAAFDRGCGFGLRRWFIASGLLAGIALMLRPNLLLFPPFLALAAMVVRRREVTASRLAIYLVAAVLVWAPWPIRNYQLTGRFIPATTHGGIQLWYGSLQSGEYFENWFANPRAQHESPPFSYSVPDGMPVHIRVTTIRPAYQAENVALTYWTQHDTATRRLLPVGSDGRWFEFEVPPQADGTVLMFFTEATWTMPGAPPVRLTVPIAGKDDPKHHTISSDHVADLDLNRRLLDVFDVAAMADHVAFNDPMRDVRSLDLNSDGAITQADIDLAAGVLTSPWREMNTPRPGQVRAFRADAAHTTIEFADGSSLKMPRALRRTVDTVVTGSDQSAAANVLRSARTLRSLTLTSADVPLLANYSETLLFATEVNRYFARREPFWMDRYNALAAVNIAADPAAFAVASAKRLIRMFVVIGSSDNFRSAQFSARAIVFAVASALSGAYLLLFLAGAVALARSGRSVAWLLLPVIYIPATIFMMLPNMRYSVTAQPFVLMFVSASLVTLYDWLRGRRNRR